VKRGGGGEREPAAALRVDRARVLESLRVSRETLERLDLYADLILKWQKSINLIAPSTLPSLWTRHILDSAQIAELGGGQKCWVDIGSGAGFPGLVIALLAEDRGERSEVHLIESDRRKASFLREAARIARASVVIHAERAESALPSLSGRATAVSARALAPLAELLGLAEPLLTTGATGFFPKGQALESEIERASTLFEFEAELVPSRTDESGRIAVIRNLRRRPAPLSRREGIRR